MTKLVYALPGSAISDHQLQVVTRGCCRGMVGASYIQTKESLQMTAAVSGLFHLRTFLTAQNSPGERSDGNLHLFKEVLGWLRRILEALDLAEEYLIPFDSIGLELDFIYFETRKGRALLLLNPSEKGFIERLQLLCMEIFSMDPRSNADVIAERLLRVNAECLLDRKAVLRLLSSWEYELG